MNDWSSTITKESQKMRYLFNVRRTLLLVCAALVLMSVILSPGYAHKAPKPQVAGYTFPVRNKSQMVILALLTSEDGKRWGKFDIGEGLESTKSVKLEWDESTDNSFCDWWIKAVYDNGNLSAPAKFDFCKANLVIEFK